jgi:hypothetical protein
MVESSKSSLSPSSGGTAATNAAAVAAAKNNNNNNNSNYDYDDEHFMDDSTFDRLLWSDSPEDDYLKHIINEQHSSDKEYEKKLPPAALEPDAMDDDDDCNDDDYDDISINREEKKQEERSSSSSATSKKKKKSIGNSLERIFRFGSGSSSNKKKCMPLEHGSTASRYQPYNVDNQTSLSNVPADNDNDDDNDNDNDNDDNDNFTIDEMIEETEREEEVQLNNILERSVNDESSAKSLSSSPTTSTKNIRKSIANASKNKFVNDETSVGSISEEIENANRRTSQSQQQQLDVEEGGGNGNDDEQRTISNTMISSLSNDDDTNSYFLRAQRLLGLQQSASSTQQQQQQQQQQKKNDINNSKVSNDNNEKQPWWIVAEKVPLSSTSARSSNNDDDDDDDSSKDENYHSPHNSVSLSLPSLSNKNSTPNRKDKDEDKEASSPVTPSRSYDISKDGTTTKTKTKDAPGTPSTVIIRMGHTLGLATPPPSDTDDDYYRDKYNIRKSIYSSDSAGSNDGDDEDDDYHDGAFDFLKRAAKNNKLYRRLIVLVVVLLTLFVVLIVVAFVQLAGESKSASSTNNNSNNNSNEVIASPSSSASSSTIEGNDGWNNSPIMIGESSSEFDISGIFGQYRPSVDDDADTELVDPGGDSDVVQETTTNSIVNTTTQPPNIMQYDDDDAFVAPWEDRPTVSIIDSSGDAATVPPSGATANHTFVLPPGLLPDDGTSAENLDEILMQVISERLPETVPALVYDPSSPQYRAYEWTVRTDPPTKQELEINPMRLIQRYVLAVLYFMTNGNLWTNSTGWLDTHDECSWFSTPGGAEMCDPLGRIYEIDLRGNNLTNSDGIAIPSEFVLLSNTITYIRLSGNSLTGSIPSTIFDGSSGSYMTNLQRFHVQYNSMTGKIGTGKGLPNLRSLRLDHNFFVGTIPWQLSELSNLESLVMAANNLSGGIPFLLGDLSALSKFWSCLVVVFRFLFCRRFVYLVLFEEEESLVVKLTINGSLIFFPCFACFYLQPTSILVITSFKVKSHLRYLI